MRISLLELRRGLDGASLASEPAELGLPTDVYVSAIQVDARIQAMPGGWRMTFAAQGTVVRVCDRCLSEVELLCQAEDACLILEREEAPGAEEDERVLLVEAEQEWVEVDQVVRDALRLALPDYFTCRENCQGLCTQCGQDLNEGDCGCASPLPDSPLRDLARLRRDSN